MENDNEVMGTSEAKPVSVFHLTEIPKSITVYHGIAANAGADRYFRRLAVFILSDKDRDSSPFLLDADQLWLVYRDERGV